MGKRQKPGELIKIGLLLLGVTVFWIGATTELKLFGSKPDELLVGGFAIFIFVGTAILLVATIFMLMSRWLKRNRK